LTIEATRLQPSGPEETAVRWVIHPFVEWRADGALYHPLTGRSLSTSPEIVANLAAAHAGEPLGPLAADDAASLAEGKWIVPEGTDVTAAHRLRIVSLETNTACNQKCYFCPVSTDPRERESMPEELFASIVSQLRAYPALEAVFLQSYNEPTVERRFVDHCRILFDSGLPVAVLTNGSGLVRRTVDAIMSAGKLRFLSVNLSTLDRERYAAERGADHLDVVLRNLDYLRDLDFADEMKIVVLGEGGTLHDGDFAAITARFAASRFAVERHVVMDRAGWLELGLRPPEPVRRLGGCDNVGSRPLEHLHITPRGACVLCCEDYDEKYVVGDLTRETIDEVLTGPAMRLFRRWTYGLEEAPDDFICRHCVFAKSRDAAPGRAV
jgi:hypothetical protein